MAPIEVRTASRVLIAGVLVATVALAGCGRRGPLEAPSAAATTAQPGGAPAEDTGPTKPDKPFVLDPLL